MAKKRKRKKRITSSPKQSSSQVTNRDTPSQVAKNHAPRYYQEGPLRIRLYGHPALRQKTVPIPTITDVERKLVEDMLTTLYSVPNGVGLAAPQVGVLKRLIVIDVHREDVSSKPLVLINPEIQSLEGESIEEEGCLSIPDIIAEVKRATKAVVTALNLDEETISVEGEGLLARVLQHEVDHLDGVLFIDHVSGLKRQLLRGKLKKLNQQSQ
jgi:peptide deformylase